MFRKPAPREGELYKTICVADKVYTISYGFYSEEERLSEEPIPIFPDFLANPEYTKDGQPIVTRIQDACRYYQSRDGDPDGWCADCIHYPDDRQEIGICRCEQNRCSKKEATQ